jgi:hypothetical protein
MNLLPTEQRKRFRLAIFYQKAISSGLILLLLLLVLILLLGGFLFFLNFTYQFIEGKIATEQSKIIQIWTVIEMEKRVEEFNNEIIGLKKIHSQQSNLYQVLDNISRNLLKGVEVHNLEIHRDSGMIMVSGYSSTRENLLIIKEILETNPDYYKDINFPLSNLTNPRDIDFHFSFTYKL